MRPALSVGGNQRVGHQHRNGHRPDAARHRRDGAGPFGGLGIGDIADEARLALALLGRRDAVDADVDDGGAGLDPVALDHFGAADGGDQNVGGAGERRQVLGAAMGDGDGAVGGKQQVGHRLADDVGAADDDGVEAGQILAAHALDQQHRAGRRAGHEGGLELAGAELADIDEMKAVDILFRRDGLDDLARIDMGRAAAAAPECRGSAGSALSSPMSFSRSASDVSAGSVCWTEMKPHSLAFLPLEAT